MPPRILLLVDDEVNILRSLKRLLRHEEFDIVTANSGKAGLELLKTCNAGVILSDQRMPEMTGTEFLCAVKNTFPDNVRLILSGYTDQRSITEAINQGAIYRYLTKPWEDVQLKKNILEAFDYYEYHFL